MRRTDEAVARFAPTDMSIVIDGPDGAEKVNIARTIHRCSQRADQPLYEFSGSGLSTAALRRFANGDGPTPVLKGTVFIDAVDRLDPAAQAGLLEVFEKGTWTEPHSGESIQVDARFVTASQDLSQAVADGRFRADLYYRLNEGGICLECDQPSSEETAGEPALNDVVLAVRKRVETELIRRAMQRHAGDRHEAARALAISYRSLCDKIQGMEAT